MVNPKKSQQAGPDTGNVPCREVGAKWQGGAEGKLRSNNRGLDVVYRGTHNSASNNIRGEHSCVVKGVGQTPGSRLG
jgi:hypothetical protein